jgi:hypothetical protein
MKWLRIGLVLLLAIAMTSSDLVMAKKKDRDDGGPPLRPGIIFVRIDGQTYGMKSDGSGMFAALPFAYSGTPSFRRYGAPEDEHRWWLSVVDFGPGPEEDPYVYLGPDGTTITTNRTELFAFRDDPSSPSGVSSVQLTNFYPHVKIGVGSGHRPEWANDGEDSYIGFKGVHYAASCSFTTSNAARKFASLLLSPSPM